jgi:DNA polymerase-4
LYAVFTGPYAEKERVWSIAQQVKQRLAREFGDPLTCSIGLAPTVFLAKTASDMRKPDGLVWLDAQQPSMEFFELELRDLCGIGANMHERLKIRGIRTVKQLWHATPQQLRAVWGGIEGERFWQALHGIEPVRPEITPRQIGHSKILHPRLRHEEGARAMLDRLVYKAALRLRREGFECGEMHIKVKPSREVMQASWAVMARFPSTQEVRPLLEVWRALWQERPVPIHKPMAVAVDLCRLQPQGEPRLALFAPNPRDQALSCLLDQVAKRHGAKALWFGSAQNALSEDVPRIAFQSLPDVFPPQK